MAYGRERYSSVFDSFSLSPLPYPVLLILLVVLLLLGVSSLFAYESLIEDAEEQLSWLLLAVPLLLILLIRWVSSLDSFDLFGFYPYDRPSRSYYHQRPQDDGGGASPWGVAAVVVLLLLLVNFHSTFRDMWRV